MTLAQRTHWEGCWSEPGHGECKMAEHLAIDFEAWVRSNGLDSRRNCTMRTENKGLIEYRDLAVHTAWLGWIAAFKRYGTNPARAAIREGQEPSENPRSAT